MASPLRPDPRASYRPYCDRCGGKLWDVALMLEQARNVAWEHAFRMRHAVRIEPWDSFALVEAVPVPEFLPGPWPSPEASEEPAEELAADHGYHDERVPGCPLCERQRP